MLCARAAAAPILGGVVTSGSLHFFAPRAVSRAMSTRPVRVWLWSLGAGVRNVKVCNAMGSATYTLSQKEIPNIPRGVKVEHLGSEVIDAINTPGTEQHKKTAALCVLRSVADFEPTALEERDIVDWPKGLTLREVLKKHAISPNKNGDVFVLAGPENIGNRAFYCVNF